jgi:hypothetical protein
VRPGHRQPLPGRCRPKGGAWHTACSILARAALSALLGAASISAGLAIEGGAPAGRNRVSRAAVGIATISTGAETIGLNRCTGALIAPDLVLTAAHCVGDNPVASAVVLYDEPRPVAPAIRVAAVARYDFGGADLPPGYESLVQLSLDTAVLRLVRPVRGRQPLRVGRGPRPPSGLRLAGAGLSEQGVGVLRTTQLDPVGSTSTGLLIARTRGSEVCQGDSGGPIVADGPNGPVLWGVASAVVTSQPPCGRILVIAPATPALGLGTHEPD